VWNLNVLIDGVDGLIDGSFCIASLPQYSTMLLQTTTDGILASYQHNDGEEPAMRDGHMAKSSRTKGRHQQLDQFACHLSHGVVDEHRFACRTSSVGSHHCTALNEHKSPSTREDVELPW
jgi:hypothetical protein